MSAGTEQYEKTYGKITDENLAQLKDRIGVPLRPTRFGTPIPEAHRERYTHVGLGHRRR